jgi:hypothetical protein
MNILPIIEEDNKSSPCKGLTFKGEVNVYFSSGRLVEKRSVILQKRLSCPGCGSCGWFLDDIDNFLGYDCFYNFGLDKIEHGKYYTLSVEDEHRDLESGIVDDYTLTLTEITLEKVKK